MRRGAIVAALLPALLLLGGCLLHSRAPLIARSDVPDRPVTGTFQIYMALAPEAADTLPRERRAACFDPGYAPEFRETPDAPVERRRFVYCDQDPDDRDRLSQVTFSRDREGFKARSVDGTTPALFLRMGDGFYLLQTEDKPERMPSYHYWLVRPRPGMIEIFLLPCSEFPSIERDDGGCDAATLAAIRPGLDAAKARALRGASAPAVILRR